MFFVVAVVVFLKKGENTSLLTGTADTIMGKHERSVMIIILKFKKTNCVIFKIGSHKMNGS